jgi:hypothetical protein
VAFLDDDDLMAPGRVAAHLQAAGDAGFTFCSQVLVDPARSVLGSLPAPRAEGLAARLRIASSIGGPSAVVGDTALLREVGGFAEDLYALADWDLWLRLAARAEAVALPGMLVAYTVHPVNMHLHAPDRMLEDFRRFDRRHRVGPAAELELLRWLARDLTASGRRRTAAAMHLRMARRRRSLDELATAARVALPRRRPWSPPPTELAPLAWLDPYRCAGDLR